MKPVPPQKIATQRLVLNAGKLEHAGTLFANYTGNEKASKYLQRRPHSSIEATKTFLENWGETSWGNSGRYAWVITEQNNLNAIGLVILIVAAPEKEIHFGISPEKWGQGYATEAVQAVMHWIMHSSDINAVTTFCDSEHGGSSKVLLKSGFKRQELKENYLSLPAFKNKRDAFRYLWKR